MKKAAFILGATMLPAASAMAAPSFLTSTTQTDGPGYTYLQGDYIPTGHLAGTGHDFNGFGFRGSYQLPSHIIVQGGYDRLDVDHSGEDVNRAFFGVGAQGFYDYGGRKGTGIGYYGTVNYERLGLYNTVGTRDVTGTGFGLTAGLRWMVAPQVEINPHATYVDYGELSGDGVDYGKPDGFKYGVQLVGYLDSDQHYALTAGYDRSDLNIGSNNQDFHNEVNVGARYTF
ncbi:outer membrane beta-barrel protein [Salinisphaera sp. RV14]|uniref:outer membrane beta-barrel protein n=1 Tax=unclassified Salinisphaera TaxID=2649847 RepID=UPI003F86A830